MTFHKIIIRIHLIYLNGKAFNHEMFYAFNLIVISIVEM